MVCSVDKSKEHIESDNRESLEMFEVYRPISASILPM